MKQLGCALGPCRVEVKTIIARVTAPIVGHTQIFSLRMVAFPPFGSGIEFGWSATQVVGQRMVVDYAFPFFDVVHYGVTHLAQCGRIKTPGPSVKTLVECLGAAYFYIICGTFGLFAPWTDQGREECFIGSFVSFEARIAVDAIG